MGKRSPASRVMSPYSPKYSSTPAEYNSYPSTSEREPVSSWGDSGTGINASFEAASESFPSALSNASAIASSLLEPSKAANKESTSTETSTENNSSVFHGGFGTSTNTDTSTDTSTSETTSTSTSISAPSSLSYGTTTAIYLTNTAITNNSPTVTGDVDSYSIAPALPTGLSLDTTTGIISGTPTATTAATSYTITATNTGGTTTATITIRTGPGFQVNSTADTSDANAGNGVCATAGSVCTLRAAVEEINALSLGVSQLILVPAGTITLSGTEISLDGHMEIIGASQTTTIIDGNDASRVFIANTSVNKTYIFTGLTIQNGNVVGRGACLRGTGNSWALTNVTINSCENPGGTLSGGVDLDESGALALVVSIDSCKFTNNTSAGYGGAFFYFSNNVGSTLSIADSTFTGNRTQDNRGGAMYLIATNATLSGNLFASNTLDTPTGPAVYLEEGIYTVTNNTFRANTGPGLTAYSNTVAGLTLTATNNTFVDNTSNACFEAAFGVGLNSTATIANNIFKGNSCNGFFNNCNVGAAITSNGGNVTDQAGADCNTIHASDLNSTTALLDPLADNGGPTQTMALQAGSPGVDQGVNASCPTTDQRGYPRPVNGTCDAGAFERQ